MTATETIALAARPAPVPKPGFARFARQNRRLIVTASVFILLILIVTLVPFALGDPNATAPANRLHSPSAAHWLGTDGYGRDVLTRVIVGGRISLALAGAITVSAAVLGTLVGLVTGFYRAADAILMRIMDAWMAFPGLILAMALVVAIGGGPQTEIIALTIMFTPFTARTIRARTLSIVARQFVDAAKVSGMRRAKILIVHVLPNVLPLALVQIVMLSSSAMLVDGGLSFLGLGVAPPTPTWGNIIAENRAYMFTHPALVIAPGLAIVLCAFLLNVTGAALHAVIDPDVREREHLYRLRMMTAKLRRRADRTTPGPREERT